MPNLVLQPGSVPSDQAFPPAGWQILLNTVAAYLAVSGLANLDGVIISATEPEAADRTRLWAKRDEVSSLVVGLYAYNGGWLPIPVVAQNSDTAPANPKKGQLWFDTVLEGLHVFDGAEWTSNLYPLGRTDQRPETAAIHSFYFDSTIGRLLRKATQGWTTADGAVGDLKMVDFASEDAALTNNPGWSVFRAMDKRFPLGAGTDLTAQKDGGVLLEETELKWTAQGRSAESAGRKADATFIASLTLNGVEARADGTKMDGLTAIGGTNTVKLTPPYRTVIFLKKDF